MGLSARGSSVLPARGRFAPQGFMFVPLVPGDIKMEMVCHALAAFRD